METILVYSKTTIHELYAKFSLLHAIMEMSLSNWISSKRGQVGESPVGDS